MNVGLCCFSYVLNLLEDYECWFVLFFICIELVSCCIAYSEIS
jgi:hypothetical protein